MTDNIRELQAQLEAAILVERKAVLAELTERIERDTQGRFRLDTSLHSVTLWKRDTPPMEPVCIGFYASVRSWEQAMLFLDIMQAPSPSQIDAMGQAYERGYKRGWEAGDEARIDQE